MSQNHHFEVKLNVAVLSGKTALKSAPLVIYDTVASCAGKKQKFHVYILPFYFKLEKYLKVVQNMSDVK